MILKTALFFTLIQIAFVASPSFAGNEGGRGGNGIYIKGKLYVFDLVEKGLQEEVWIDEEMEKHPSYSTILKFIETQPYSIFKDKDLCKLLALKLLEVGYYNSGLGYTLYTALNHLRFYQVDKELVDAWEGTTVLEVEPKDRPTIAVRKGVDVRIDKELYKKLVDTPNRAALIFHELLFATILPDVKSVPLTETKSTISVTQNSDSVRAINGELFHPALKQQKGKTLLTAFAKVTRQYLLDPVYFSKERYHAAPTVLFEYGHEFIKHVTPTTNFRSSFVVSQPLKLSLSDIDTDDAQAKTLCSDLSRFTGYRLQLKTENVYEVPELISFFSYGGTQDTFYQSHFFNTGVGFKSIRAEGISTLPNYPLNPIEPITIHGYVADYKEKLSQADCLAIIQKYMKRGREFLTTNNLFYWKKD